MARPTIRTSSLMRDDAQHIKSLFGSIANAYKVLNLTHDDVPMSEFRRAIAGEDIRPVHAELVQARWHAWKAKFLKPGVDFLGFTLNSEVRS